MTDIRDILDKDSLHATLQEVADAAEDHWGSFAFVIVFRKDATTCCRYYGSDAEVIGMLDLGRAIHMEHFLEEGEEE